MSDFRPHAVRIGKVGKHPNADTLSITTVYGHPVIFRTGEILPGDLCLYVPPDALVNTDLPQFSWLDDKANENGIYRVKLTKIRGVPSYGFLVPLTGTALSGTLEGTDLRNHFGITKYEPEPALNLSGEVNGDYYSNSLNEMIPFYDIENVRRHQNLFAPCEQVVVTEKIHGTNARFIFSNGELHCGSRTKFRKNSVWNQIADQYKLDQILAENPGICLYGEIFGPSIQDLTYGVNQPDIVFFDAYDTNDGTWKNTEWLSDFCLDYFLPMVPVLYEGQYECADVFGLAEGKSVLANLYGTTQVREGIVVKPAVERWDQNIGRVFLKLPGEGYLLRNKSPEVFAESQEKIIGKYSDTFERLAETNSVWQTGSPVQPDNYLIWEQWGTPPKPFDPWYNRLWDFLSNLFRGEVRQND